MRTIAPMLRRVLVGVAAVTVIAVCIGGVGLDNILYVKRVNAAINPKHAIPPQGPTITEQVSAIRGRPTPGIVTSIRIQRASALRNEGWLRRAAVAVESLSGPITWPTRHRRHVEVNSALVRAYEAHGAQLLYADRYLGDAPSLVQIKTLPDNPEYLALGQAADRLRLRANALSTSLMDAEHRLIWVLPTLDTHQLRWRATDNLALASACASAELAGRPAPSTGCVRLLTHVEPSAAPVG